LENSRKNDGASIQVIYAGTTNDEISAHSVIVGQKQIDSIKYPRSIRSATEQYADNINTHHMNTYLYLGLGFLPFILSFILSVGREVYDSWKTGVNWKMGIVFKRAFSVIRKPENLLPSLIYIGIGIYNLFFNTIPIPPF
jgi:hypothetical protein